MTEKAHIEKPRPLASLVASARRLTSVDLNKHNEANRNRRGGKASPLFTTQPWQEQAWDMFDLVGEERFMATTLAGRMSKARLYVGKLDEEDLTDTPSKIEDPAINKVLQVVGGTPAGRSQIIERLGTNLFVAGEGWLVGIPDHFYDEEDTDSEGKSLSELGIPIDKFQWRMLSTSEVSVGTDKKVMLKLDQDFELEVAPDEVYMVRVWRPHPRWWWEADSSTRSSLSTLKELVGLTLHISAQVESRLAGAGLLVVPQGAQAALQRASGLGDDVSVMNDEFTEALITAMMTPIEDRASAAAVVPLVVTVPDELVSSFNYLSFSSPLDASARSLRDDSIRRLALGQDAPPELLLGTAGMNHWGGWLVQEDVVATHLEPPLSLICDALTTQYLWPVLEGMKVPDYKQYVIWYDVSHLVVRPNKMNEAMTLHGKGLISDEKMRQEAGYSEDDAPRSDSPVRDMLLDMVRSNPGMLRSRGLGDMEKVLTKIVKGETLVEDDAVPEVDPSNSGDERPAEASPSAGDTPGPSGPVPTDPGAGQQ